jgi:hypothetical protein
MAERSTSTRVPKGVRHNPVAEQECQIMLIERKTTLHTGSEINDRTRSLADQLRPVKRSGTAFSSGVDRLLARAQAHRYAPPLPSQLG